MTKLLDFKLDAALNALRARMGIPHDQFGDFDAQILPGGISREELEKLVSGEGIDVDWDDISPLPDGTLGYKDGRVLVYIRDHRVIQGEIKEPRYHFSNCRTLLDMRARNRFSRYVIAAEITGRFRINIIEGGIGRSEFRRLSVCQNCLDHLSFDGFKLTDGKSTRTAYVKNFVPARFFEKYPRSIVSADGLYSEVTAPLNTYSSDWKEVSARARRNANWICSSCGGKYSASKERFLHTHHMNGVASDNRDSNLQVLCLGCHAEEPQHHLMKQSADYKEFLKLTGWRPPKS
jgi:hypothetical protein